MEPNGSRFSIQSGRDENSIFYFDDLMNVVVVKD